ncbi:TIGR03899 family protein [Vibrio parahaemolyticus]|uniref:TIGR03899 family protein n=1 Tax=Vibrio parahaemolyticus TaxID=670 RepID=UPI001DC2D8E0|nr:TIGR03899 family protein [Vibrio parahaemolyticus]EGR3134189.1 TIGR03899 family protein [Vibrio parahaemolyticus]EGR3156743.1 TIGR03899 family protein [Vibrio parahaemolyticus]EHY8864736.1 TIGR03899 family protein [Vibrio parahaemolyticus]EII3128067.1 TIGR03899 family protein [Vibrio parahaemolyticus]EJG1504180.1 TIGR03899 family protein [Vibrio parahaemolyticus]
MAEPMKQPVVIEHQPNTQKNGHHDKKTGYIKDSASRIKNIAQSHGLDALLQTDPPAKSALERAQLRDQRRQEQRQKNLEQILKLAHSACRDETAGEPDQDWLYRFFDMAQDIHNSSMQKLWAQVMKREVTNPGSTSMKALKVLKDMSPKEAQTLQRAASLACSFGGDNSKKLLIGYKAHGGIFNFGKRDTTSNLNMGSFQLPYSSLLVLIELGLLHSTELESGEIGIETPLILAYQGKNLSLQVNTKGIRLLYYRFTPTGNELCKLLGNKPNSQYYDQMLALLNQKFSVSTEASSSVNYTV